MSEMRIADPARWPRLARVSTLRRHDFERSQYSSDSRPHAPAGEETTGTQPRPESERLDWVVRHCRREPTFWVKPIGLGEDVRIV
jgi:hypothetical protein